MSQPYDMRDLGPDAGFVVLSTGEDRRPLLWECLASIRRNYPNTPTHVVTDHPVDCSDTLSMTWVRGGAGYESRRFKTRINKFSPFKVSVLLDDDTVIHKSFGRADAAIPRGLGDDIAMAADAGFSSLADYRDRGRGGEGVNRAKQIITRDVETLPYFSSGVMIWRDSEPVREFFQDWNEAWLPVQERDQQPLIEAQVKAAKRGRYIGRLSDKLNFVHERKAPGKRFPDMDAFVVHFWKDKLATADRYTREMEFPRAAEPTTSALYRKIMNNEHQMTPDQYRAIGAVVARLNQGRTLPAERRMAGAKLLVFGCGSDSPFWKAINAPGETLFVESDPVWAARARAAGCTVFEYRYPSQRGVWFDHFDASNPDAPTELVNRIAMGNWDVVLIDGPAGNKAGTPGREIPIMLAACQGAVIFVHDWNRPWEKALCDQYLNRPDTVINGTINGTGGKGDLAVWARGNGPLLTEVFGNY